jgi:glycine dehydrogenase subunit 1
MSFLTNSDLDIQKMLRFMGIEKFEQLINNIPEGLKLNKELNIPDALSEYEVSVLIQELANNNRLALSFLGGGVYDHYIPAVIDTLISRSEFYTAYTPYQPEISQGTLQSIYEFQSMISELTCMDVTNASMYEGGSALAEAMLLACAHTNKKKILLAGSLNNRYKKILKTYSKNNGIRLMEIPVMDFRSDLNFLKNNCNHETAAVIIQHPNYFGYLEEVLEIGEILKKYNALYISFYDPISLGLLMPPGEYNADIAVAEGQSLGIRQNYGGPYLGLFSVQSELIRKMPGRIVGLTKDLDGNQGFVLTLQTREQHIRREKATSNICTNSGLMALAATIYLSLLGKEGMKEIADLIVQKSYYLANKLNEIDGICLGCKHSFFKEFVVTLPVSTRFVLEELKKVGIFGGIDLRERGYEKHLLIAVTEKRKKTDLDLFISEIKKIIKAADKKAV